MASASLSRSISSSPTNPDKFTISFWVKRNKLGAEQTVFGNYASANFRGKLGFVGDDRIEYIQKNDGNTTANLITTRKFRDTNAWYHCVVAFNTNESTSSDRIKIYINGSQVTDFAAGSTGLSHNTYPSSGDQTSWCTNEASQQIGRRYDGNKYFDGMEGKTPVKNIRKYCMGHEKALHRSKPFPYNASAWTCTRPFHGNAIAAAMPHIAPWRCHGASWPFLRTGPLLPIPDQGPLLGNSKNTALIR